MSAAKGIPSWNAGKGKGYVDRRGYRWIRVDGKNVREHRHVMEMHLGRKLLPTEIVHHLNGVTTDNKVDNLEVMHGGDHMRLHHKGETRPDLTKSRMSRAAKDREKIRRLELVNADLYEALKELIDMDVAYQRGQKVSDAVDKARAALAKAEGKQS